jgi:phospholipase/carboxylesterase
VHHDNIQLPLSYLLVPARTPSRFLAVVLHGQGGSSDDFRSLKKDLDIDQLNYLLLDAPIPYSTGFRWFDWAGDPLADATRSRALLGRVFTALEEAGYAPSSTFLIGFSQGCVMTLEFGARYNRRLAAYIGISGFVLDPVALLRDLSPSANCGDWLITHGAKDQMVSVEKTRTQIRLLQEGGFKIDYREYEKAHSIDNHQELPQIRGWITRRMQ